MGKRKKTNKSGASLKENKNESKNEEEKLGEQKFTLDDLLKKVQEYMENFNFELADRFCTRAVELSPDNLQALNMAASVYLEVGKIDEAVSCLRKAIEIEPSKGYSKYMTLGELLEGEEAVECLKNGIELMICEKETNNKQNISDSDAIKPEKITDRDISNGFCSVAEIYLTDCWFQYIAEVLAYEMDAFTVEKLPLAAALQLYFAEDAEDSCKIYCEEAIKQDPENPDAYQVMANLLLSEQENEEAREMLLKGLHLWNDCDDPNIKSTRMPSYESRISLSKMLIEVEEFDNACTVLEELLSEDDEVVQVWYLLGWTHYLKEQDYNLVIFYLEKAQKLFTQTGCDDEPLLEHINELLVEVREKTNRDGEEQDDDTDDEQLKSMDTTE